MKLKARDLKGPCRLLAADGYKLPELQQPVVRVHRGGPWHGSLVIVTCESGAEHRLYPDTEVEVAELAYAVRAHVTVVTHRGGRRINSGLGARVNLCGAELTLRDMLPADALRTIKQGAEVAWGLCPACIKLLEQPKRERAR